MTLGCLLFISCTLTGTYLDVENECHDDDNLDGRDEMAVIEEWIGELDGN